MYTPYGILIIPGFEIGTRIINVAWNFDDLVSMSLIGQGRNQEKRNCRPGMKRSTLQYMLAYAERVIGRDSNTQNHRTEETT